MSVTLDSQRRSRKRGRGEGNQLTQSDTAYWALFEARYRMNRMTTLTVYIRPDSTMMCIARRSRVVSVAPSALAKTTFARCSMDHILYTIKARREQRSAALQMTYKRCEIQVAIILRTRVMVNIDVMKGVICTVLMSLTVFPCIVNSKKHVNASITVSQNISLATGECRRTRGELFHRFLQATEYRVEQ